MAATDQDISIYEGEDKIIKISVTDTEGGSPVDLSGSATIVWRVTTRKSSDVAIIEKTMVAGIALADDAGTKDQIVITLDSADSQGLEGDTLYHECRVVDASSKNHIVAIGSFTVTHSATG